VLIVYYYVGKQGFKEAATYLEGLGRPEAVVCYGIICPELKYYYPSPMDGVGEKKKLTPEFFKGKTIISRRVDWTESNWDLAGRYCRMEEIWKSAGYKENILVLLTCR
jgi:hypothetical protein